MQTHHRFVALLCASTLASALAACSGGGGGGTSLPAPSGLLYTNDDAFVLSGVEIDPLLPVVDGDVASWSIDPALPGGLVLDPVTGVIAGSADAPAARSTYTVTASNARGSTTAVVRLAVAAPARFAFTASPVDDSLAALSVDALSGRVARAGWTAPAAADAQAEALALHPSGRFGYLPHAGTNTVAMFAIDPATGATTRLGRVTVGAGPHAAVVDPTGAYLLVAARGADAIERFAIDPATGGLTPAGAVAAGAQPSDLAFDRAGTRLFVTCAGTDVGGVGSALRCFAFTPQTGALAPLGAGLMLNGGRPSALCVDPLEDRVYLALRAFDGALSVRYQDDGTLSPVPPLHVVGDDPVDVEVDPRGRAVWVANAADGTISALTVDAATGGLDFLGTTNAGAETSALSADALGERLYAVARGSSELLTYAVEADGALSFANALALRGGSASLALARGDAPLLWTPRHVRVASRGSDEVETFAVDAATGALTSASVAFTGDAPVALAVDAARARALVALEGAHALEAFGIDAASGALSAAGPAATVPGTPAHVVYDASGRFAYVAAHDVATAGDGWLLTCALDPVTGQPTVVDAKAAGSHACFVALDPTGEYAYVANRGDGTPGSATITAYRLDASSGLPTAIGGAAPAPGIASLAFHPDGGTIYAVLRGSDAFARYTVDRSSGGLTPVPPAAGPGLEPSALAIDPTGRFAYASYTALEANGEIDVLPLDEMGALGAPLQQVVDGSDPVALAIEASGRFLYAANKGSDDLSTIAIDAVTGLLTVGTPVPTGDEPVALVATTTTH